MHKTATSLPLLIARMVCLTCWLIAVAGPTAAAPASDGLFATFSISRNGVSVGEIICQLEFEQAPLTVANFVGLAEGTSAWIDFRTGSILRQRFYDGIAFHRVEAGFVIQAGLPEGLGDDGPGYTFPDEFSSDLRHDRAGILSMANDGMNTNGSQFFITLNETPWLNDRHSVFGAVIEGIAVADSVKPGDVIDSVSITRIGEAANGFDPNSQGVPQVKPLDTGIVATEGAFTLQSSPPPSATVFTFRSEDLMTWEQMGEMRFATEANPSTQLEMAVNKDTTKQFFKQIATEYPIIFTPMSVTGRRALLTDIGGVSFSFSFPEPDGGRYSLITGEGELGPYTINNHSWKQEAYRALFYADIFNVNGLTFNAVLVTEANITFVFDSPEAGTYTGQLLRESGPPVSIKGTFILNNL